MKEENLKPWRFTIEFDPEKAEKNGYDIETLYDYVGKNVEPMGNVRIAHSTWQAINREVQFGAQCPACAMLSRADWVMKNVKSWRTYEDGNEPNGSDYLEIIRRVAPERLYE